MENAFGGIYPFSSFEEVGRKNMAMFEQAMNMMSPFNAQENDSTEESPVGDEDEHGSAEELDTMKAQLEAMQRQLDTLSKNNKG